jgi:integrase/recombinase XerC
LRQLARSGRDALLDEMTLILLERLGLRRIELCRLRINDIDYDKRTVEVWGKGDKQRIMPIPPQLFDFIETYLESRRPARFTTDEWRRSSVTFLRRPPAGKSDLGRATGRRRIEDLFTRLALHAPDLLAGRDVSLHSYRHALGTFTDRQRGRAMTRAVLGQTSRLTPTDHYVHIQVSELADLLAEYEQILLARPWSTTGRSTSTAGGIPTNPGL